MQRFNFLALVSIFFFTLFSLHSLAQNPWELGGEYMRPIGNGYKSNITALRYENFNEKNSFSVGLTYHFAPKDAYGGFRGFGMYAGYRYSFGNNPSSPFIGLRTMFSFENFDGKTNLNSLMFTPVGELGYHFVFGGNFFTTPSVGYGYTIKVTKEYNTREDDEGGRIIPGMAIGFRFNNEAK